MSTFSQSVSCFIRTHSAAGGIEQKPAEPITPDDDPVCRTPLPLQTTPRVGRMNGGLHARTAASGAEQQHTNDLKTVSVFHRRAFVRRWFAMFVNVVEKVV